MKHHNSNTDSSSVINLSTNNGSSLSPIISPVIDSLDQSQESLDHDTDQSQVNASESFDFDRSETQARESNTVPLSQILTKIFSSLHGNPVLPNNVTDVVFKGIQEIFSVFLNQHLSPHVLVHCSHELGKLSSFYKRLKYFEDLGTLVSPEPYIVGRRMDYVKRNGRNCYRAIDCVAQKIPLRLMLKKFFSIPNLLMQTLGRMNSLMRLDESKPIEHFVQGTLWKQKMTIHGEKIVIPLFLQVDDFETQNALGSHSGIHKLGAAYISLPTLPTNYVSQLNCIFLALLYHSQDRVEFGNEIIFKPLIEQFNDLIRNGIHFDLPDFQGTVYFELAVLLGDNLGIHSITGFCESFSGKFPCRMCRMDKSQVQKELFEKESLLRNLAGYEKDLLLNDPTLTGIKEKCIWLKVDDFDFFNQIGYDVMHDLSEGCSKYVMCSLIVALIDRCKYFTISILNDKISSFEYGPDKADKPVTLSILNLRKGNLRLTASEMCTFCKYFGVMVGPFVPQDDRFWSIYILLMRVINFCLSPVFLPCQLAYFKHLVSDLCESYTSLFNVNLKPKFHNLLHYASAMERFGPLRHLSSMRYEAKHRPNKLVAKSSSNRINMTLTIARKHQLMFNDLFIQNNISSKANCGQKIEIPLSETENILNQVHPTTCVVQKLYRVPWTSRNSVRYNLNCVIVSSIDEENVHFARVDSIYVSDTDDTVVFKAIQLKTIAFDDHVFAYHVQDISSSMKQFVFIDLNKMQSPFVCNCTPMNNDINFPEFFVVLRKPISP
ncbi:uncharacterized protein LOC113465644 [Diaphorina citri]|uniref:Uncharacterized protein LOC113465644 n=1 Tax=Diaphorina citri TaxID=121845 RepID=A0A3Q0IIU1_DIACI|nr:uncharacterized protein LOC113465644 [Diaphorina citri]